MQKLDPFFILLYCYLVICRSKPGLRSLRCSSRLWRANEIPSKKRTVFLNWFGCCSPRMPISHNNSSCSKEMGDADIVPPKCSAHLSFIKLSRVNFKQTISWSSINFQNVPFFSKWNWRHKIKSYRVFPGYSWPSFWRTSFTNEHKVWQRWALLGEGSSKQHHKISVRHSGSSILSFLQSENKSTAQLILRSVFKANFLPLSSFSSSSLVFFLKWNVGTESAEVLLLANSVVLSQATCALESDPSAWLKRRHENISNLQGQKQTFLYKDNKTQKPEIKKEKLTFHRQQEVWRQSK